MSASRRYRRQVARYKLEQQLAADEGAPVISVGTHGPMEMMMRGRTMFVLPRVQDGMNAEQQAAITDRREATLSGTCPRCGARRRLHTVSGRKVKRGAFAHETDCVLSDDALLELLGANGGAA